MVGVFTPGTPIVRKTIAWLSEKLGALLVKKTICVCESDRQLALSYGIGNKHSLITIRSGISNNCFPVANPLLQPPRLIMVARFNEQKDQTTLLEAIAQLENKEIHLDLVGSGSLLESCQKLARSLGIVERVSFCGARTRCAKTASSSSNFSFSVPHYVRGPSY